ncbi:MAG: polyphosphate kinase 1 [Acidobacteriota bacterium]
MAEANVQSNREENISMVENVALPKTLFLNNQLLLNRELNWLEFNYRVLEEALDRSQPLLERLKFLSIFSTNLDEFFMIRVSGLKQQIESKVTELSPDGMMPAAQLKGVTQRLRPMVQDQMRCLTSEILPALAAEGLIITPYRALSEKQKRDLKDYFLENVFPVLTPQAVDPSHRFPYISNLSLNIGMMVDQSQDNSSTRLSTTPSFIRVKVPPIVPRLIPVGESGTEFILLEELIAANTDALFPGVTVGECFTFRVTRDADIEIREDEAGDLLQTMERELRKRRFGHGVRLEVSSTMPGEMVRYLASSIGLTADDVYTIDGPLNVPDLMALYDLGRSTLKDRPYIAPIAPEFKTGESMFDVIRRQDVLVHHPYQSFSSVVDFIRQAAADPDVLAIKMTLYRTGTRSPIVQALMEASEGGKQVAVLVELKARFDEENNIEWARRLERSGVHVVYGVLGLKTHCKVALVVRRESGSLIRYIHIGTGNYNPATAKIYTDLGLFTTNPLIGADVTDLFNFLTGFSRQTEYRKLLVAPVNLREKMTALIEREIEHHKAGLPAHIIAKINSLTDTKIIRSLYEASQAGVPIDLIVRGVCMLRPGVPGLSSTIEVHSIVGRFLEHSRIYYFANGGAGDFYLGSADWMLRNLDRRVEVITPIEDANLQKQLKRILDICLKDNVKARRLLVDGKYERVRPMTGEARVDAQAYFMNPDLKDEF